MRSAFLMLTLLSTVTAFSDVSGTSPLRGSPAAFDPGPPQDSKWPDIFAETPNYLGIGQLVNKKDIGPEYVDENGEPVRVRFRWQFGPMFYRGRLTPNSVKVLVVGQEGAQDENVSNRTFTGSTGTKMQNFLSYFGIERSYLFLNTFMYTINGQYGGENGVPPNILWVAQDPTSPVVQHRHRAFDYVLETNPQTLRLVIGVGRAGQDSVVTWIQHLARQRGFDGQKLCPFLRIFKDPNAKSSCDASFAGLKVVGLPHPGAASALNGGDAGAATLKNDFPNTANRVREWIETDESWGFEPDTNLPQGPFVYKDREIPHADFPFGAMWNMGNSGTSSNRDSADAITAFSEGGCYNSMVRISGRCANKEQVGANKKEPLHILTTKDEESRAPEFSSAVDVAWEPPKNSNTRRSYDPGPPTLRLARLLMGQEPGYPNPDFISLGATAHPSFGLGGTYRGRLNEARVLVLADQESWDDLFTSRAWTGSGGQKLQAWLKAAGIVKSYAILRTLPVDTLDLDEKKRVNIVLNESNLKRMDELVREVLAFGKTEVIVAVGKGAEKMADQLSSIRKSKIEVIEMDIPSFSTEGGRLASTGEELKSWKKALKSFSKEKIKPDPGQSASYEYNGEMLAIPRQDLPYGTRFWVGQSGSRVVRAYNVGRDGAHPSTVLTGADYRSPGWDANYYQIQAPSWVRTLKPLPLSQAEREAVEKGWLNP